MTVRVVAQTSLSAEDFRLALTGLLTPAGAMQARGGVVPGSGGALSKVSGMTVRTAPVQVWVDGTSGTTQGMYLLTSDANVDKVLADGDATRDRIDLIVARVKDNAYDGSGATAPSVDVVQGAYAAVGQQPVAPALPASSEYIGQVRVNAGTTSGSGGISTGLISTASRRYAVAAGGILPVVSAAERDALVKYEGLYVDRADTDALERWTGSAWEVISPIQPSTWTALPLEATYQSQAPNTLQYRKVGDEVQVRGSIMKVDGSDFTGLADGQDLATLPVGFRPNGRDVKFAIPMSERQSSVVCRVSVSSADGKINAVSPRTPDWLGFDVIRFSTL